MDSRFAPNRKSTRRPPFCRLMLGRGSMTAYTEVKSNQYLALTIVKGEISESATYMDVANPDITRFSVTRPRSRFYGNLPKTQIDLNGSMIALAFSGPKWSAMGQTELDSF